MKEAASSDDGPVGFGRAPRPDIEEEYSRGELRPGRPRNFGHPRFEEHEHLLAEVEEILPAIEFWIQVLRRCLGRALKDIC